MGIIFDSYIWDGLAKILSAYQDFSLQRSHLPSGHTMKKGSHHWLPLKCGEPATAESHHPDRNHGRGVHGISR